MAVELITNAIPLMNGKRPGNSGSSSKKAEYKLRKHRLEKLDSTISELPQCFEEWLNSLNGFSAMGIKLASLLEIILQETPLLSVVLRYKEACEHVSTKCQQQEIRLQPEFKVACKKVGPCVSALRNCIDSHAKAVSKYESAQNHLEAVTNADSPSKQKLEQAELKFKNASREFANEDTHLAKATDELDRLRVETMGACFLSLLETQSQLLTSAAEIMSPLGSYKEVGTGLIDSQNNSSVKEAILSWLAASQVHRNLRTFGGLSRNDIQCMMYSGSDGLPTTIQDGLNEKVNKLIKSYICEVKETEGAPRIVPGGFHLNPKGIELALKDCCSEVEALGAGAPHATTREEKEEQIERDIPRTLFHIGSKQMGGATGTDIQDNIQDKLMSIEQLANSLPITQQKTIASEKLHNFAFYVLNEACTTVTNTAAKTAVQLLFGKANLVLVRPSPSREDNYPIKIATQGDATLLLTVQSTWWLVEDFATLSMLSRHLQPDAYLAIIDTTYTLQLSLDNFLSEEPALEIPTISVECRGVNDNYFSTVHNNYYHKSRKHKSKSGRKGGYYHHTYSAYPPVTSSSSSPSIEGREEDIDDVHQRIGSSEGDSGDSSRRSSDGYMRSPSDSGRLSYGSKTSLYKCPSSESISTATSSVTVKASQHAFDSDNITDLLDIRTSQGLTRAHIAALDRPATKRYSQQRREKREERDITSQRSDRHYGNDVDYPLDGGFYSRQDNGNKTFYKDDLFIKYDKGEGGEIESSQIMSTEGDTTKPLNTHPISNSSAGSLDSGIVLNSRDIKHNDRGYHADDDKWGVGLGVSDLLKGKELGPLIYPPVSSDSDSESTSGRDSGGIDSKYTRPSTSSERSSSSNSFHSSLPGSLPMDPSLSLPDDRDYRMFNQAVGANRGRHHRHPSISSSSSELGDRLSQPESFDLPGSRNSFSQEVPGHRGDIEYDYRHGNHFSGPYEHEMMRPGGGPSQYHYGSDPYPCPMPYERPSRSLNRSSRMREDFSPSPGPMHRHHHGPPPVSGPNGPPFWEPGYGPPPMHGGPPPPRGHMNDMQYRSMHMYRPTTPESGPPSISPAPSPHPTPPTTPPPSHHPPMMRIPPHPGPHPPPHHRVPPGPMPIRGEFDYHMQPPGPPPMRPPPMMHPGGPHPLPHGPAPPHPPHGRMPSAYEWDSQWMRPPQHR